MWNRKEINSLQFEESKEILKKLEFKYYSTDTIIFNLGVNNEVLLETPNIKISTTYNIMSDLLKVLNEYKNIKYKINGVMAN